MERIIIPSVSDADPHLDQSYGVLNSYNGYDNPDLIVDLRRQIISASRSKKPAEARRTRKNLINKYLDDHIVTTEVNDVDIDDVYNEAYENVRYWLSVSHEDWAGDINEDGTYAGNGLYDELALSIIERQNTEQQQIDTEIEIIPENLQTLGTNIFTAREAYALARARQSQTLRKNGKKNNEASDAEAAWSAAIKAYAQAYQDKYASEKPEDATTEEWQEAINSELIKWSIQERLVLEQSRVDKVEDRKMNKVISKLNSGGVIKRLLKGAGIGLGVGIVAIPLAAAGSVVGAAGIVAGGAYGLNRFVRGFAGWQHRSPKAQELMTADQAAFEQAANNDLANQDIRTLNAAEAIQRTLAKSREIDQKAAERDRSQLRKSVAIGAGAVAAGALVSWGVHLVNGRFGLTDRLPWNHDSKPTAGGSTEPQSPGGNQTSDNVKPSPSIPDGSEGPKLPVDEQLPPSGGLEDIPVPTPPVDAHFESLMRLVNAEGKYPWDRAESFFNGDQQMTDTWIRNAATKAGATWHGSGTNAWISIDGVSDTDYVWKKLVDASLQP